MKCVRLLSLLTRSNQFFRQARPCRQCPCALSRNRLLSPSSACARLTVNYSAPFSTSGPQHKAETAGTGLWSKIKFDLGFISGLKYSQPVLNLSGFRMYICCTEMVDFRQFFTECEMPDTFNSWFLVTNLHIWLCMVRLASLGKDGRLLRNSLVRSMWQDVETRSKQLGDAASLTARKEGVRQMADIFHASLFAYDEGLLGDDKDLAGAVWRVFFQMRQDVNPQHLELMVAYIRKQVPHIASQLEESILHRGFVSFLPLRGDTIDEKVAQKHAAILGRMGGKL